MSKPKHWMPLYVADYLADTGHLSAAEHGAYFLLIMHYWSSGAPLPADDRLLARIARMDADEWSNAKALLQKFFKIDANQWRHIRVEEELKNAKKRYDRRADAGRKGGKTPKTRGFRLVKDGSIA